jgi:hypothetical protein
MIANLIRISFLRYDMSVSETQYENEMKMKRRRRYKKYKKNERSKK